jgi:hypothetical protein
MIGFSGSYDPADVTFLLTPVEIPLITVAEKEELLREGRRHYSEVLSVEAPPSPEYFAAYRAALSANSVRLAQHIVLLSGALAKRPSSRAGIALVSFARAGTPIGVLLSRALRRLGLKHFHYSISIVRDRGLDEAALDYILERHDPCDLVFIDGWTGKGAISMELRKSEFLKRREVKPFLAVVADPAGQADLAATGEDYLIPSGILNGIVSGLISRSVIPNELRAGQFHSCRELHELAPYDVSRSFVDQIDKLSLNLPQSQAARHPPVLRKERSAACARLLATLQERYKLHDVNRIKPGIAEATRAVLRRQPREILIARSIDGELDHLRLLCSEREVPVRHSTSLEGYRAVAILD